jgi:two-component system sensor histidine kinase PilS (NtrC family)
VSRGLQRYNLFRFFLTLSVLAWGLWVVVIGGWAPNGMIPFLRVAAVALCLLIATTHWTRTHQPSRGFIVLQLVLDIGLASVLASLTGGRQSIFVLLYFPAIAGGAYLVGQRGAIATAVGASLAFITMVALTGGLVPGRDETVLLTYTETMFRTFAFFLIAMLTGQLAESLARSDAELEQQRRSSEILAVEHGTVLDRVRAGVITTDPEERIATLNPFALGLLGSVAGKRLDEIFAWREGRDAWEENRPDGSRWACSEAGLPNGGRVVVLDDITELSRMRERAARDERLVEAGRLAASLAHEIRNPLASLSGSIQLIREEHPSRLSDLALHEAERLNRLVDDFLTVSSRPRIARHPIDVHVLVREVCDAFARDTRFRGKVEALCSGQPARADADPDRLRQAVWNLVINGAQAMPRGGRIRVDVRPAGPPDAAEAIVVVKVADEGVGIPDGERDRVFDAFYTTRSGGTGLGLALVDQVVRAHGGSIRARPGTPNGTEFVFWIPVESAHGA